MSERVCIGSLHVHTGYKVYPTRSNKTTPFYSIFSVLIRLGKGERSKH